MRAVLHVAVVADAQVLLAVFAKNEIVFARTSPQHKLEIGMPCILRFDPISFLTGTSVSHSETRSGSWTHRRSVSLANVRRCWVRLTSRGRTGDGVNDSPALKKVRALWEVA